MSEWTEEPLATLINPLETGKRPVGGVTSETEGPPSLGGENINVTGKMSYANVNRVPLSYARLMSKGKLKTGDTLINKDGAQTGKVAQYDGAFPEAWINEHVFIVRAQPERTDPAYLFYSMLDDRAQRQIASRITGSAQPGLNSDFASAVTITLPRHLDLQRKIAGVLRALDTQIEATEALISKHERVRAGLMQDLFTRGVDEHGQLRPPREESPHLYHQTELGWLPLGWEALTLFDCCSVIRDGTHLPPPRTVTGPLLLSVRNMVDGKFELTESDERVPQSFFEIMHRNWRIRIGDTLLAIVGATIGKSCQVPAAFPLFTLQRSVCVLRGEGGVLDPDFLALLVQRPAFNSALWSRANQTAQPGIYLDQIGKIFVPVPSIEEQKSVCAALKRSSDLIDVLRAGLSKLHLQKSGLMQDLLTGRVSVAPLLQNAAA